MAISNHRGAVIFMAITALLGWIGLGLQLNILISAAHEAGETGWQATIRFLSYFTVLTNLLAALNLTIILAFPVSSFGLFLARPSMQTAITCYLIVVSAGYNFLLRHLWSPSGTQFWADELLHDIVPLLYFIYWLFFVVKGKLNGLHPLSWLVYPFIFLLYMLMRGSLDGFYPYPFLNVEQIGYKSVAQNAACLMLAFLVVSYFLIVIDKLLYRRKQRMVIT